MCLRGDGIVRNPGRAVSVCRDWNIPVVVATGKYVGEGFDLPRLDTLMLALPVSWKGLIAQYAGRLHRRIHIIHLRMQSSDFANALLDALNFLARLYSILAFEFFQCSSNRWASAAKSKGIPISVISEGMGHDSETTTRIYLASLDTSVVDKANSLILKSL